MARLEQLLERVRCPVARLQRPQLRLRRLEARPLQLTARLWEQLQHAQVLVLSQLWVAELDPRLAAEEQAPRQP